MSWKLLLILLFVCTAVFAQEPVNADSIIKANKIKKVTVYHSISLFLTDTIRKKSSAAKLFEFYFDSLDCHATRIVYYGSVMGKVNDSLPHAKNGLKSYPIYSYIEEYYPDSDTAFYSKNESDFRGSAVKPAWLHYQRGYRSPYSSIYHYPPKQYYLDQYINVLNATYFTIKDDEITDVNIAKDYHKLVRMAILINPKNSHIYETYSIDYDFYK